MLLALRLKFLFSHNSEKSQKSMLKVMVCTSLLNYRKWCHWVDINQCSDTGSDVADFI